MKVLIIEDENIAVQRLNEMLMSLNKEIEVVNVCDSVEASIAYLRDRPDLDLIFMDIELGDGRSLDIFNHVQVEAPVIFITAYQEHALKAFKQNSIDYLLKPLNKHELESAITKYNRLYINSKLQLQSNILELLNAAKNSDKKRSRFLARTGTRLISVPVEHVAYFYTKEKFQYIKTRTGDDYIIDSPLDEIEKDIDPKMFFRANRQFIISYDNIEKVHAWFNGKLKVQVSPVSYEEIIVSRLRAADFKKWLGE